MIVLNNPPIHSLKMHHDRKHRIIEHFLSMDRFVVGHVASAFLLDNGCGKRKFHFSVEDSPFVVGSLTCIIALKGGNFIAEELRLLRSPMRNERFGLAEFQVEDRKSTR